MAKLITTRVSDALHSNGNSLTLVYLIRDYNDIIDNFPFIVSKSRWFYVDVGSQSISKLRIDINGKIKYESNNGCNISTVLGNYKANTLAELKVQSPEKYMEIYQEFNESIFGSGNYFASSAVIPINSGNYRTLPRYGDKQYIFIDNAIEWLARDVL